MRIQVYDLSRHWTWLVGLVLAMLVALTIRPLLLGALLPVWLRRHERLFIVWAGGNAIGVQAVSPRQGRTIRRRIRPGTGPRPTHAEQS